MILTRRSFGGLCLATAAAGAAGAAHAQEPVCTFRRLQAEGLYLPQYLELKGKAAAGDEPARWQLSQYAAFLGDEEAAIGSVASPRPPTAPLPDLTGASVEDALDVIAEAAADRRIVILNEAHNHSRHRGFAAQVMRRLRPLGFDWFAAEAFMPRQPEPAPCITEYRPGMPFLQAYGYYSRDPVLAETVREAARLGYRFADYEFRADQYAPEGSDMDTRMAYREEAQAENLIADLLAPHPEAKVFVYCGYSHAMEAPTDHGEWFASRLKRKTGVDPLTIDQAYGAPDLQPENDEPHVAAVLAAHAPDRPVIVRRADGSVVGMPLYDGQLDLSVIHPRLAPVAGRPGWLAADPERRAVEVNVPAFEGRALLQTMWAGEGAGAVPADQFLLKPDQTQATVLLHPGSYFLRLETQRGIEPAYGEIRVEP